MLGATATSEPLSERQRSALISLLADDDSAVYHTIRSKILSYGQPASLCLVYLLVARRLHLPVAGIGMPGHFVCRYQSTTEEVFIDAFNGGKLLTKADCIKYLHSTGYGLKEDFLGPLSSRRILLRTCV